MPELLIELFSEEIPATMQTRAADDLKGLVCETLEGSDLSFERAKSYVTPRRLALVVYGIPVIQPARIEETRGPRVDAPEAAIQGFLKRAGVSRDHCEERESNKGIFLFSVIKREGRLSSEVLAEQIPKILSRMPWPKSMRWAWGQTRWVRPLHAIVCVFDGEVIPFSFANITSGNITYGHKFHAPKPVSVNNFDNYSTQINAAKVLLDFEKRKNEIICQASVAAEAEGFTVRNDPSLIEEIAGLVEWPVALMGRFDQRFMSIPHEVLVTTMRINQKYLSVQDRNGKIVPRFITVANIDAPDGGEKIISGNEYVLTARLSDAEFFWNQDRRVSLESRIHSLENMVYHEKIGSVAQRIVRIRSCVDRLAPHLPGVDLVAAKRAATLSKSDLVTGMVREFPSLQGVMGRYYALSDKESAVVAEAIGSHYSPAGPADNCPTEPTAICLALADKLDNLIAFWSIGEKPTGSRDPFALRRAALGVIRLVLENRLRIPILEVLSSSETLAAFDPDDARKVLIDLLRFISERLRIHLRDLGVRHDLVSAIFGSGDEDDLLRAVSRVEALAEFLEVEDGTNLLVVYRRAVSILRKEEQNDKRTYDPLSDSKLFKQKEETTLKIALDETKEKMRVALARENFQEAMIAIAHLRVPIDEFFASVTVNTDDIVVRKNRLSLLSEIRRIFAEVGDFGEIEL